jgi:Domain of unknown function (DUF4404)
MTEDTINRIKSKIEKSDSIQDGNKQELLGLISVLQSEIEQLAATNSDRAETILDLTHATAHEATRKDKESDLYERSLDGLRSSVHGFENSHPQLVEVINSICNALSNLGI